MTLIASVIAKNGVVIIADSLVTNVEPIIKLADFYKILNQKKDENNKGKIKKQKVRFSSEEIDDLFHMVPSYTKNYEDKLIKYDNHSAITIAGNSIINKKRISQIIQDIAQKYQHKFISNNQTIEEKIEFFIKHVEEEIKLHFKNENHLQASTFLFTNYDIELKKTTIYKIGINYTKKEEYENNKGKIINKKQSEEYEKVVCTGQNRMSERLLYGDIFVAYDLIGRVTKKVISDYKIDNIKNIDDYISNLRSDRDIISQDMFSDIKLFKLEELSLQQAVDLAYLLMKIEVDFQQYTENIPTVGGVIKIAVIDENGFKFVAGDEIISPIK